MNFRQRSYFWRLLYAFLAGGLVPFILLSFVFGTVSTRILENAYRDRAVKAVLGATDMTRALLDEVSSAVLAIARSDPVRAYVSGIEKNSWMVSEVNRLFSSTVSNSLYIPYVIPLDGSPAVSRNTVPDEYRIDLYSGWGILGELVRSSQASESDASRTGSGMIVYFGQPHPLSLPSVPLAVGAPVYSGGVLSGYVIMDVGRQLFSDRVGSVAGSGGALTNLFLTDKTRLVLYNMTDAQVEGTFAEVRYPQSDAYFISRQQVRSGIEVCGMYPVSAAREYTGRIAAVTFIIAFLSALVSLGMAILLSRSFARPVHMLTLTMERISQGQLDAQCPELPGKEAGDEIAVLIHRFNRMIDRVNDLVANLVAQERDLRRSETAALQAQINPHFLYNTLNSIRAMAKLEGSKDIADMTTSLARIMREGSYPGTGFCSIEHSLSVSRDYFAIESWRWPGRFTLGESVGAEVLRARIPRLIVQPVVENALVHGLEEKEGPGALAVTGEISGGDVILTIADTGAGMTAERLAYVRARLKEAGEHPIESSLGDHSPEGDGRGTAPRGAGIALINTHRRLILIYGQPYGLDINSEAGGGTTVRICFPFVPFGEE